MSELIDDMRELSDYARIRYTANPQTDLVQNEDYISFSIQTEYHGITVTGCIDNMGKCIEVRSASTFTVIARSLREAEEALDEVMKTDEPRAFQSPQDRIRLQLLESVPSAKRSLVDCAKAIIESLDNDDDYDTDGMSRAVEMYKFMENDMRIISRYYHLSQFVSN